MLQTSLNNKFKRIEKQQQISEEADGLLVVDWEPGTFKFKRSSLFKPDRTSSSNASVLLELNTPFITARKFLRPNMLILCATVEFTYC
jgi:hypothetical protein